MHDTLVLANTKAYAVSRVLLGCFLPFVLCARGHQLTEHNLLSAQHLFEPGVPVMRALEAAAQAVAQAPGSQQAPQIVYAAAPDVLNRLPLVPQVPVGIQLQCRVR
jgi:hypothetical protein